MTSTNNLIGQRFQHIPGVFPVVDARPSLMQASKRRAVFLGIWLPHDLLRSPDRPNSRRRRIRDSSDENEEIHYG
jgi:hypothetical protein